MDCRSTSSVSAASTDKARKKSPKERARSVPFRRPYLLALLLSALFYLALVGTSAALFAFLAVPNKNSASLLIGFAGFSAFLWLVSFFKRRGCICPLCKGTPYVDSAALRHEKAFRFFPLNYGTSNVIRSLFRQHFRCQYCGTPYDLLKRYIKHKPDLPAPAPAPTPAAASTPAPAATHQAASPAIGSR